MATGNFYTFSKRKNSTLQPTGTGTQIDLQLKSGTSLISPTFLITQSGKPSYNYVSFEGRYYFINDIVSVRQDLWEISCNVDALASWKSVIGSTTAMILYATGGRGDIPDQRIGVESDMLIDTSSAAIPGINISSIGAGSVVLSVTGIGSFGDYFLDNRADLPELLDGMDNWMQSQGWAGLDDMANQLVYGGPAADCVKNCIALPFSLADTTFSGNVGPAQQLYLGKYPCATAGGSPLMAHRIVNPVYRVTKNITIPWAYSDWRRHSPYTAVFMYLPFIGMISLSSDEIEGESSLDVTYAFNLTSGDIAVEVQTASVVKVLATASTNVAMGMTFGSANVSVKQMAQAAVTGIGGLAFAAGTALSGGSLLIAGAALFGGVTSAAAGLIGGAGGDTHGGGGLSGGAVCALTDHIMVYTVSKQLTDTQANLNPIMGKPVMGKHTIGTYAGFVQTSGCQVAGDMFDQERETINRLCDGGIYYE
jgi:hypothetical protein